MINWLLKIIKCNTIIGIDSNKELAKHRLYTTKYEDLCM
jgi:hypothetical protein